MLKFLVVIVAIAVASLVNGKPQGIFHGPPHGGRRGSNGLEQGPCGHEGSHGSEWRRPEPSPGYRGPPHHPGHRQDEYPRGSAQNIPPGGQSAPGGLQPNNTGQNQTAPLPQGNPGSGGSG